MRIPRLDWLTGHSRAIAVFAAGMIVGAAVFMAVYQHNLNLVLAENQVLSLENRMLSANEKSRSAKQQYISGIDVHLELDPKQELDIITRTRLRYLVSEDLNVLRGQRVDQIAPATDNGTKVFKTLFKKLYEDVNGKNYLVEISNYVIVYGVITVWATVEEYNPK